jgi:glycosyltransferase involved in cell wall biosynthesis
LNRGLELARGRYIARQDADDISLPDRLGKQISFLETHPSCALVGTWAENSNDCSTIHSFTAL